MIFVDFFILSYVGLKPAEGLYLLIARIGLVYYFIFFLIITPFIISPIVVHFFWATNLVNYLSHYNGVLRNCPELFPIYPWGWKHKDHHLMYENGILQRIT